MRILGLLLIPFFLFAAPLAYVTNRNNPFADVTAFLGSCRPGGKTCFNGNDDYCLCISGKMYSTAEEGDNNISSTYNLKCLLNNAQTKQTLTIHCNPSTMYCYWNSSTTPVQWYSSLKEMYFCKNKSGYVYNSLDNAWYPTKDTNASPICPAGKIWNTHKQQCVLLPKCNLTCNGAGMILDRVSCVCKCAPALTSNGSECVPNTNLNKAACVKAGGIYLANIPVTKFFSDPKYAYLVMSVPLFTSHICYTQQWVNAKLGKIKNALSPTKVLSAAISLLPLGKIKYLWGGAELAEDITDTVKNPKVLLDQKPVIATKYNPDTGAYEPIVNLKPRDNSLNPLTLLQPPKDTTTAQNLIDTAPNLKDFLNSPFASKWDISTPGDLTDAVTEYNIDHNLRAGTETKISDDLREIFNRSKPQESTNFPITIKDNVGEDTEIPAEVQRSVTPVPNTPNAYNVKYIITPKSAKSPVIINYYVTKSSTASIPDGAPSTAPDVIAKPTYHLGQTTYVGREIIIKKNISPNSPTTPTTKPNTPAKITPPRPNYNSFVNPAQNAITRAFNYKISLFTCPSVTPKCPNSIIINWNNMGIKGKYKIPDPMCAVIRAINNPKISPAITTAGNVIVLLAGILGALSLFRRN